jgi:hypothetical protein
MRMDDLGFRRELIEKAAAPLGRFLDGCRLKNGHTISEYETTGKTLELDFGYTARIHTVDGLRPDALQHVENGDTLAPSSHETGTLLSVPTISERCRKIGV